MSYIIKIPNFLIAKGGKSISHVYNYKKLLQVTGVLKFPNYEQVSCQNCQYSTVISSRHGQLKNRALSISKPTLSFVSYMSSGLNEEKFQVVITNPIDNTTSTSEISLNSSNVINSGSTLPASTETIRDSALEIIDPAANVVADVSSVIDVVEPSLVSLGLASNWTPVGLVQQIMEFFHVTMDMPWWMAIATCTVIARILLIPLLVKTQKNAIHMSNVMPQLQYLQSKFGEARRQGNAMETSRYASEIMTFMKENKISPLKNALWPMLQAPVFLSFFMGLRSMAKLPVETMKEGGLWWTMDLTIPDPYYILPIISCSTLYVILKLGAESGVKMDNLKSAKYIIQFLPVIIFPFCMHFQSAVLYYWCTNNFCTLMIVSIMKIEPVRKFLKMPKQQKTDPKFLAVNKGFIRGMKDAYEDQKVLATVEDRKRIDAMTFQKAGTGPIPRTYSYDPTKPRPARAAAAAAGIKAQARGYKT